MIQKFLNKIVGDQNSKKLKTIEPIVKKINEIFEEYKTSITDQKAILAKTAEFKERIKNGESLDDILPEAFALVKIACVQLQGKKWEVREKEVTWDMTPYDVQLIGGIVMHQGNITEMKTGEGKTLVCTMPVYLNALTEKGVFVVTVNDYLAQRDAEWMKGLYEYLGLTVGVVIHDMSHEAKKEAYGSDITYGTNNEFGFDYLRDNMTRDIEQIVQRELNYAIIDEVDSILIDEARTPLIISTAAEESGSKYQQYAGIIPQLKENIHFDIDEKSKSATLTEEGIAKMEEILGMDNIYTEGGFTEVHHIEQALRAYACYKKDQDYIVKDEQVIIIDSFTGRLMPGRRYSQGLHQAIEAKERVDVKRETKTLATVTFQNYFRMFNKLAGMTGTAITEAEEFYQIYGLDTIVIPTNKPIARIDAPDSIYKNTKGKYKAITKKIAEIHKTGRPILVGTISVEQSEILSKLLKLEGIKHNVLNAKQHSREADIVSEAGKKDAVTIATNMAGRGTDIKIDQEVKELGGLFVMGTERHESRRIDNQLRGRSGRQGDPGTSQFFVSMEDDIMRLFGGDKIKGMMSALKLPDDVPIESAIISRSIESAQKRVEGHHFDIRKHVVEYDDVMNIHRDVIYKRRHKFLFSENHQEEIAKMISNHAESVVRNHSDARQPKDWNYQEIWEAISAVHKDENNFKLEDLEKITNQQELIENVQKYLLDSYKNREEMLPNPEIMRRLEKAVFLRTNDMLWMEHIDAMSRLREDVAFSGMAQRKPLIEYQAQGYEMFSELLAMIEANTVKTLFKIDLEKAVPRQVMHSSEPQNIRTNESQIEAPLSGHSSSITRSTLDAGNANPVIIKADGSRITAMPAQQNTPNIPVVGRNDLCPCGSGKKYKKCHGIQS